MPKPTKGPRLGGSPAHERIILANLASQLFEHGRITTTETRARRVQPLAEKLISKAKRGDLHARRLVKQTITNSDVVHVLFAEIAPKMTDREGGYTRITKVGPRKGDNAPMAVIELVTEPVNKTDSKAGKSAAATQYRTVDQASADNLAAGAPDDATSTEETFPEQSVQDAATYDEIEVADEATVVEESDPLTEAAAAEEDAAQTDEVTDKPAKG